MQTQTGKPPAGGGNTEAQPGNGKLSFWKRPRVILLGTVVLAALFFLGLYYVAQSFTHESTDDAFLDASIVAIAPKIAGQVKKVYVTDNQRVKAGDPLMDIDPRDFQMQLAQKKAAQVAADSNTKLLESTLQMIGTQVETAQANARQSGAQVAADQARADKAGADLKRAEDLIQKKIISSQEYDAAKAAAAWATATLQASQQKTASDGSKIAETQAQLEVGRRAWERAQAQAAQANVDVQQADLNLSYTHIAAPQDGQVTRKAVEEGDYVQTGQRFMALVLDDLKVIANFKETQLKKIRLRQPVRITVDSVAGRTFTGKIESIQAGSGAAFSLLPPENAVGNYVKVVQRVPVKILFDNPVEVEHVLGPGMSAEPSVQVKDYEVPDFVVFLVAMILATATGYVWWRVAKRKVQPA